LEERVTAPLPDTNVATGCFIADTDPTTGTDPEVADTDGDTCEDGAEDANANGAVDAGETDPNLAGDCPVSSTLPVRIDNRITALTGGSGTCGLDTVPA